MLAATVSIAVAIVAVGYLPFVKSTKPNQPSLMMMNNRSYCTIHSLSGRSPLLLALPSFPLPLSLSFSLSFAFHFPLPLPLGFFSGCLSQQLDS